MKNPQSAKRPCVRLMVWWNGRRESYPVAYFKSLFLYEINVLTGPARSDGLPVPPATPGVSVEVSLGWALLKLCLHSRKTVLFVASCSRGTKQPRECASVTERIIIFNLFPHCHGCLIPCCVWTRSVGLLVLCVGAFGGKFIPYRRDLMSRVRVRGDECVFHYVFPPSGGLLCDRTPCRRFGCHELWLSVSKWLIL